MLKSSPAQLMVQKQHITLDFRRLLGLVVLFGWLPKRIGCQRAKAWADCESGANKTSRETGEGMPIVFESVGF